MKKAVIVVGPHFSGKSKTIKKYFKPLVGLSGNQRKFVLNGKPGIVLSQSLEEKRLSDVKAYLSPYLSYQWLVLAARPSTEGGSHLNEIRTILEENGFSVPVVEVTRDQPESLYEQRADDILAHLLS